MGVKLVDFGLDKYMQVGTALEIDNLTKSA